ncbi:MAG: hypothetical protein ACWA5W_04085 [Phycisphaerales bacterium]
MSTAVCPDYAQTRSPILWGAYLACSWTWCIGMFFPALLLRDTGWSGFLIFAIPNVLGAAAMGWVITSRIDSQRFVENHPTAIWWFSTITLIFHVFWLLWISNFVRLAFPIPENYLFGVAGAVVVFSVISSRAVRFERMPQLAIILLVFSVAVLIATFVKPAITFASTQMIESAPDALSKNINSLWMIPLMSFGFIFCPYLDITFHHARQGLGSKQGGRLGFTIGFVAFFSLMIILTTRYAGVINWAMQKNEPYPDTMILPPWLGAAILTHILCQWIFTVRVHLDRMKTIPASQAKQPILMGLALLAGLVGFFALQLPDHAGLTGGELVYRIFLSFYGLLFPTYMLYRAVLKHKEKSLSIMWTTIAIASPVFWMGFMERQSIWLIPGMVIILLGALVVKAQRTQAATAQ